MPVKRPVATSTVPAATLPLIQVPPITVLLSVVAEPTHTPKEPVELTIVPGRAFTVTTIVVVQPVTGIVLVIVVVPAVMPLTKPLVVFIVATAGVLLLQVPPVALVSVVLPPTHIPAAPVIGPAPVVTVITLVTWQPPAIA